MSGLRHGCRRVSTGGWAQHHARTFIRLTLIAVVGAGLAAGIPEPLKPGLTRRNESANGTSSESVLDPIDNICFRFFHQATIKNSFLYVDGGQETFVQLSQNSDGYQRVFDSPKIRGYNYQLLQLDLRHAWNWREEGAPWTARNKTAGQLSGTLPPQVSNGALYQGRDEDDRIYLYGGSTSYWNTTFPDFVPPSSVMYSLWSFDTATKQWDEHDVSAASPYRPAYGYAAEAPDLGLAFYFNGQLDSGTSPDAEILGSDVKIFLQGMIVINTTDQSAVNVSTDAVSGTNPRTRGGAAYIPNLGGSGIVTFFGGTYKPVDQLDSVQKTNFVPLSEIDVFDIDAYLRGDSNKLWYKQTATGDVPQPRNSFCAIMRSAPDNSSHHIYLSSGQGMGNMIYDDVYVLSIPSFIWTKVKDGIRPRYGHTCHLIDDQLLTIGGLSDAESLNTTCDMAHEGVGIFNLSSVTWIDVFKPSADSGRYTVPEKVLTAITLSNESMPMSRPPNGWTDPTLAALFGEEVVSAKRSKALSTGAIVGITIGAVAAVGLSLAAWWLIWRWPSRRDSNASEAKTSSAETPGWVDPDRLTTT